MSFTQSKLRSLELAEKLKTNRVAPLRSASWRSFEGQARHIQKTYVTGLPAVALLRRLVALCERRAKAGPVSILFSASSRLEVYRVDFLARIRDATYVRAVIDTNILINSTHDHFNASSRILEAAKEGSLEVVGTTATQREYQKIVNKLVKNGDDRQAIDEFLAVVMNVTPKPADIQIDDEEDRKFIEAALGGDADIIVTNDHHLLDIGEVEAIRVMRPSEVLAKLEEDGSGGWQSLARDLGIG